MPLHSSFGSDALAAAANTHNTPGNTDCTAMTTVFQCCVKSAMALVLRRVCACMQTQVKVQMDERDGQGHPAPNPLQPPGQQTMGFSQYAGPPQVSAGPVMASWSLLSPDGGRSA